VAQAEASTLAAIGFGTVRTATAARGAVGVTGRGLVLVAGATAGAIRGAGGRTAGATRRGTQRAAAVTKRAATHLVPEPVVLRESPPGTTADPDRPASAATKPSSLAPANPLVADRAAPELRATANGPAEATASIGIDGERHGAGIGTPVAEPVGAGPTTTASAPAGTAASTGIDTQRHGAGVGTQPAMPPAGGASTALAEPGGPDADAPAMAPSAEPTAIGAAGGVKLVATPVAAPPSDLAPVARRTGGRRARSRRRPRQGQVVPLRPRATTRLKATGELLVLVTFLGLVASSIIVALAVAANQALSGL
jgi:hypothetical protein